MIWMAGRNGVCRSGNCDGFLLQIFAENFGGAVEYTKLFYGVAGRFQEEFVMAEIAADLNVLRRECRRTLERAPR